MTQRPTYDELEDRVQILEQEIAKREYSGMVLREACARFERVTEGLLGPLMIIDKNFIIEEVNARFLDRYGLQREDVIGETCYEVIRGFQEPCLHADNPCPAQAVMATGKPHRAEQVYGKEKDSHVVEEVYAFPLMGPQGEVSHVVELCHDVKTDGWINLEKNEQERLEGVIEMAGAVCLELNQPLQALSFHCERLQKAISEENLLYGQIDWIVRKIERMSDILGKLQYIVTYATKDHVEGTKIVDIDKASRPE